MFPLSTRFLLQLPPPTISGREVRKVRYSKSYLDNLNSKLAAREEGLRAKGVHLHSSGVSVRTNSVAVTVVDPENSDLSRARTREDLQSEMGDAPLTLDTSPSPPRRSSRTSDYPPHWGGALVKSTATGAQCTSGLPWWYSASDPGSIIGAGHCAPLNDTVTTSSGYGPMSYGQISRNAYDTPNPNRIDALEIRPTGARGYSFYIGPPDSIVSINPPFYYNGSQAGVVNLRQSGAKNGESYFAPGEVTQTNITVYYTEGPPVNHLNAFRCGAQAGDSGAPVFKVEGNSSIAAGILSGGVIGGFMCYYTPIMYVIQAFGGLPCCA